MISLRTWATDNNSSGASEFVSIPVPVGTSDGDLAVALIALPANISVTAPDGWTQIAQTDPTKFGIAAFYTTVLNAPARWVFALSSSVNSVGGVVVYKNVDSFTPVEASVAALTASSSASVNVGTTATSTENEEALLFLAAPDATGFTPNAGYNSITSKSNSTIEFDIEHRNYPGAAAIPATTVTHGSAVGGASVLIVLRPSAGKLSVDDVRRRLLDLLPRGVDQIYDLEPGGDYYKFYQAIAEAFKSYAFDLIDTLRKEILPSRSWYKLPDWERLFGLTTTRTARVGTVPQRQAQVRGAWRAAAGQGSTVPDVQGVIAPLLGYSLTTAPEIINTSRSALRNAQSYGITSNVTINAGTFVDISLPILHDGGTVSSGGAQVTTTFDSADLSLFTFRLTAPDGTNKTWNRGWTEGPITLFGKEFVGVSIFGTWTLRITNGSASARTLLAGPLLFVEGVASKQNTAAAIYHWGVYADPVHLGESGTPADVAAVDAALQKMRPAQSVPYLIFSRDPIPGVTSGSTMSIPGRCIPI